MFYETVRLCPYCNIALRGDEIEEHILSTSYCTSRREQQEEGDYDIQNYSTEDDRSEDDDDNMVELPPNYLPIWHNLLEMSEDEEELLPKPLHPKGEDQIGPEGFTCIVCVTNKPQIMGECSHLCCCFSCSEKLYSINSPCPVCRMNRNRLIHVFTS